MQSLGCLDICEQAPPVTLVEEPVFREVTIEETVQKEQWRMEDLPIVPKSGKSCQFRTKTTPWQNS